ncbi:DNA replication factor Cdt1-like protein [Dinothrombium tinctorium]|uniref:DNA replication factor Cdt1-like protein n=1 Tax=Dinothrombium tinctorium TaxID=1965070 RepID=A0A443R8L6_9ACAR|nr:DNA replication factor Cdt1-like protein [Dinothrombium tinctorium]
MSQKTIAHFFNARKAGNERKAIKRKATSDEALADNEVFKVPATNTTKTTSSPTVRKRTRSMKTKNSRNADLIDIRDAFRNACKSSTSSVIKAKCEEEIAAQSNDNESTVRSNEKVKQILSDVRSLSKPLSPIPSSPEKNCSPTKLSVNEVKQRLANCTKLAELRKQLAAINDCASKVKEFQETATTSLKAVETKTEKALENEKLLKSPKKYLSAKVGNHAFERYSHLATREHETGLILPFKFRTLLETFRCTDTVISMLHNRDELCTFEKVKKSVEEMMRKAFDIKRLAQIATVYPEAYDLRYERVSNLIIKSNSSYTMVITPRNMMKLNPSILMQRKEHFRNKLLSIVKRHHQDFLTSLSVPISIEGEILQRWHPNFKLEEVPDIEANESYLPKPPSAVCQRLTASFFCEKQEEKEITVESKANSSDKIKDGILKGISSSLLMRVRQKEALSLALEMVRKPEEEKKLLMIKRLPEFIKILHNYFLCDGRGAILIDEVLNKCVESYHTFISLPDVKEHILLLAELLPTWISILHVSKGDFVKIVKDKNINDLFKILNDHSSQLKNG